MSTAVYITLNEFLARSPREDDQQEELIEGELIVSPGAKVSHARIVEQMRDQLSPLRSQGYAVMNDFSCILGGVSMLIPDLSAVRNERWEAAIADDDWLAGSPELVVEVASPSNRKLHRKADIYLDHGAEQVWIVYPKTKSVTVVTAEGTSEARMGETLRFQGVRVLVTSLFSF